jgi:hypothetical protein
VYAIRFNANEQEVSITFPSSQRDLAELVCSALTAYGLDPKLFGQTEMEILD